ncbi:hypothetical protein GOP47_0023578 [Adiantum capillus-veneris]|uniref:Glycosyltransferase n=1 Tax=Adiantum capillus-veneris TaxID=13818 RepID=A0A9D4Z3I0_ADICA|nr:hypothetical protein GOP47_0023578 [Adiantum capillus-veneris]
MGKPHALVFPIPLQGHINPMMMLAQHLNSSGFRVTFLLTEKTLVALRKHDIGAANESVRKCGAINTSCKNMQNDSILCNDKSDEDAKESKLSPIEFETLPDSSMSGTDDQSLAMSAAVLRFLDSMSLVRRKVEEILEGLDEKGEPATCIVSDSFVPWTQDVADKFGIPRIEFWSSSATVYSMGYHIPCLIDGGYLPVQPGMDREFSIDMIPGLAPFKLEDFFYTNAISSPVFEVISKAFSRAKEAKSVLVNSFYDLEKDIIDALHKEGVPIVAIGPLIPLQTHTIKLQRGEEVVRVASMSLYVDDHENCLAWLDTQATQSVIYVSFGSMASLSKEEIQEVILGLEASQQPYLLVIRPDMMLGSSRSISKEKAHICKWAPQINVLGHRAIGGFLTHCGWNSIMEGLSMGVPMIGCPLESEQHTNMKCLRDEWKIAIGFDQHDYQCQTKICNYQGSSINRVKIKKELVERAVRALMQEDIGVTLRSRIQDLQCVAQCEAHLKASTIQRLFEEISTISSKVLKGNAKIQ